MDFSYESIIAFYKWLILVVLLFCVVDCFITYSIKKNDIKVNNAYANLQAKFSFLFVTLVKFLFFVILSYLLLNPPGNIGALGAIVFFYCLSVANLVNDFVRARR